MKYDLLFHQGSKFTVSLPISEDYVNYNARMQVKKHPLKEEILLEVFPVINGSFIDVELSPQQTDVDWTSAVYDIEIISQDETDVQFPYYGTIKVRPRVTR